MLNLSNFNYSKQTAEINAKTKMIKLFDYFDGFFSIKNLNAKNIHSFLFPKISLKKQSYFLTLKRC